MALFATCNAQQSVPAQEILSEITDGQPVYYEGIAVSGNLDLSILQGAQIPASFALVNCSLPDASFEGITFAQDVFFSGSSFGNASFNETTFLGRADFRDTSFLQSGFAGCTFCQPTFFNGALFENNVSFEDAAFDRDAFFNL